MRLFLVVLACLAASAHGWFTMGDLFDKGTKDTSSFWGGDWDTDNGGGATTGGGASTDVQMSTEGTTSIVSSKVETTSWDQGTTVYEAFCCCSALANATAKCIANAITYANAFATMCLSVEAEVKVKAEACSSASAYAESYAEAIAMTMVAAEAEAKAFASASVMLSAYADMVEQHGGGNTTAECAYRAEQCGSASTKVKASAQSASMAYANAQGSAETWQMDCDEDEDVAMDCVTATAKEVDFALDAQKLSADAQAQAVEQQAYCKSEVI